MTRAIDGSAGDGMGTTGGSLEISSMEDLGCLILITFCRNKNTLNDARLVRKAKLFLNAFQKS